MKICYTQYLKVFTAVLLICSFTTVSAISDVSEPDTGMNVTDDVVVFQPFFQTGIKDVTGPVTVIRGEQLEGFPSANLAEALNGLIPSLQMTTTNYAPGNESVNFGIRGLNYAVIVDGLPGSLNNLTAHEVESISVLRGMSSRAMFGSTASNGLIVVKTRQGEKDKREIGVDVEYGYKVSSFLPDWANAYEYVTAYNQARINDGLTEQYSPEVIEAFRTGSDPLHYPEMDLYNELMNKSMGLMRASMRYSGGNETTTYFMNVGFIGEGDGYMNYQPKTYHRINLRTNVTTRISDLISLSVGFSGDLGLSEMPSGESQMWRALERYPVNAYPVRINSDTFGINRDFGFNPVADQYFKGSTKQYARTGLSNVDLNFDLKNITKGLFFDASISYNLYNYQQITEKNNLGYIVYEPQFYTLGSGADTMELIPVGTVVPDAGKALTGHSYSQQFGTYFKLGYNRRFGVHSLRSGLVYFLQQESYQGARQDYKNQDFSLTLQYALTERYLLDVIVSYTGTMQLAEENRFGLFPTIGMGWIISRESFMENISGVDFLKLRGSYGSMGFFNRGDYFLYRTEYTTGSNYRFGSRSENLSQVYRATILSQIGNADLSWGVMKELDVGIDALFLNNKLSMQLDYFSMRREKMIEDALYPAIMGENIFYENFGINRYYGVDGHIGYSDHAGLFRYNGGLVFGYNTSEILQTNEPEYPYSWMMRTGNPVDAYYGFESLGLFSNDQDVENSEDQSMGNVQAGNIKYADLNEDGKIEQQIDEKMIGHSSPRYKLGLNLSISYRGFGLYIMGVGYLDRDIDLRNNPYYHVDGANKYSRYVIDNMWPNGDGHPRLTTSSTPNDNQRSTYWLVDGSYFKIKNVELSYTLPSMLSDRLLTKQVRLFVRGVNLFTVSGVADLDPENINNGINGYPTMTTYTGGLSVRF